MIVLNGRSVLLANQVEVRVEELLLGCFISQLPLINALESERNLPFKKCNQRLIDPYFFASSQHERRL